MQIAARLEQYIKEKGSCVVGFSGGVDSALLAFVARQQLGKSKMAAVTGDSDSVPSGDREFVSRFCEKYDIPHRFVPTREFENPLYRSNPENRCFYCKEELYRRLKETATEMNVKTILDGTNTTDLEGHRPGYKALKEAEVCAPYLALGMDKAAVRNVASFYRLEVATKPQAACLASRIPTGTPIEVEVLKKIDQAEEILRRFGIQEPRVRFHGNLARIQIRKKEWQTCLAKRQDIERAVAALGFEYVTLDLKPYERKG